MSVDDYEPSLAAALFLIAVDPATGRLVKRRRRRFRKALATCHGASWPGAATVARRAVVRELRAAGLIEPSRVPGRYPLVPGSGASKPFGRVRRGIDYGFDDERDVALFMFSAWTRVLAARLTRSERDSARKRLKRLITPPDPQHSDLPTIPPIAHAIGEVAYQQEAAIVREMIGDLLSGDTVTLDLPGGHVLGGDGGHGGGDSTGHGGGHHGG
jgi:hypothetical protein